MDTHNTNENARLILREVSRILAGKDEVIVKALLAILAGGHILMEDIPGVGKTTLAVALSGALGLEYNRVQFTPDVLPSDITGYSIFDRSSNLFGRSFTLHRRRVQTNRHCGEPSTDYILYILKGCPGTACYNTYTDRQFWDLLFHILLKPAKSFQFIAVTAESRVEVSFTLL